MAENIANDLIHMLEINIKHKDFLGQIRHWDNLRLATNAESIWIKDFTADQLESALVRSIPFTSFYECRNNLLFPKGSLLPKAKMPNLLWTPMEKALPVILENYNYNYFGVEQKVAIKLMESAVEQKATVLLVNKFEANGYIINAAKVRLECIKWVTIGSNEVLFFGVPFLPLNGKAYWQNGDFILPVGYDFEFSILQNFIRETFSTNDYIWWKEPSELHCIPKDSISPLSISSWKNTITPNIRL